MNYLVLFTSSDVAFLCNRLLLSVVNGQDFEYQSRRGRRKNSEPSFECAHIFGLYFPPLACLLVLKLRWSQTALNKHFSSGKCIQELIYCYKKFSLRNLIRNQSRGQTDCLQRTLLQGSSPERNSHYWHFCYSLHKSIAPLRGCLIQHDTIHDLPYILPPQVQRLFHSSCFPVNYFLL